MSYKPPVELRVDELIKSLYDTEESLVSINAKFKGLVTYMEALLKEAKCKIPQDILTRPAKFKNLNEKAFNHIASVVGWLHEYRKTFDNCGK